MRSRVHGMQPRHALANWIRQDVRLAFRILLKHPQSSVLSILALALGIGATSAVFTAARAWLVDPFPFPDSERLVKVEARHVRQGVGARYRDLMDWRERNRVFEGISIIFSRRTVLARPDGSERVVSYVTTADAATVMGTGPLIGRFFAEQEDVPGAPRVALVGRAAWVRRFGGRADIIGSTVVLDGTPHTVIGVMPQHASLPGMPVPEFWVPLREDRAGPRIGQQYYFLLARLKPGVTLAQARAQMDAIARALEQEYPASNNGWRVHLTPARSFIQEKAMLPLAVLGAISLCLLLLVTANVGGVLLARASTRRAEMAVRAALGAGRWRILRHVMTESVLLSLLGGAGALVVAHWLLNAVDAVVPNRGLGASLRVDSLVLLFTLGLSTAAGVFFGSWAAYQTSGVHLESALKGAENRSLGTGLRGRMLSGLVVMEIALSLVLLVAGGLLTRDFARLLTVDTGVKTEGVLTFQVELPKRYASGDRRAAFPMHVVERLRRSSGVEEAAAVGALPMSGYKAAVRFDIDRHSPATDAESPRALFNASTPGYFRALGISLVSGRDFDERDGRQAPPVAIVSEILAREHFAGRQPIGERIALADGPVRTIVGVVGTVRHEGPWRKAAPEIYVPLAQAPAAEMFFVMRSRLPHAFAVELVKSSVREVDPYLAVEELRTMDQVVQQALMQPRLLSMVLSAFALFGLLLSAMGLYGLISYSATLRTREIGVRMALGATTADVRRLVLRNGFRLAAAGLLVGLPFALALSEALKKFLALTSARDLGVFTGVPLIVLAVTLVATYLPARRAVRLSPSVTLRYQ